MGIYLKIVLGDWRNASRDKRELRVAKEMGYEVLVIASTKENKSVFRDKVEEFEVIRIPTRKYGDGKLKKYLGYLSGFRMYIREAKKIDAEIISGHNYDGLLVGYWSMKHKKKKSKLLYDSHEFELYQKERNWLGFHLVKAIERFLVKRADINMMVTDSIAEQVQKIYSLKEKPLVVRNVPERYEIHEEIVKKNRKEFMGHLSIEQNGFILMHHGGIAPGRGIEEAILATTKLENVGLVIMGYALDQSYKNALIRLTQNQNVQNRVYFKDAVSFSELYDYVAAANVGIVLIQNTCASFLYSLPNKLFENIQAMTPVIGSDLPEIGRIISEYDIGIKIKPDDMEALVSAIELMRKDEGLYQKFKQNQESARDKLCWGEEKKKLKEAIRNI